MTVNKFFISIIAMLFLCIGCVSTSSNSNQLNMTMTEKAEAFDKFTVDTFADPQSDAKILARFDAEFISLYTDAQFTIASDEDLLALFHAAYLANFYSGSARLAQQVKAFEELKKRKYDFHTTTLTEMYYMFVKARHWNDARSFRANYSEQLGDSVEAIPEIIDVLGKDHAGPTVWMVDPKRTALTRKAIDVSKGPQIIVVSHPLCHFSAKAATAIKSDKELTAVFRNRAIWLTPADPRLNYAVFQKWNQDNPDYIEVMAHRQADWQMIEDWATPDFYFLKDGKLIARVNGWPPEGRRKELLEAARQLDLPQ